MKEIEIELQALRELEKNRTQGEWKNQGNGIITILPVPSGWNFYRLCASQDEPMLECDAAYITAAPRMMALIEKLWEENRMLKQLIDSEALASDPPLTCRNDLTLSDVDTLIKLAEENGLEPGVIYTASKE